MSSNQQDEPDQPSAQDNTIKPRVHDPRKPLKDPDTISLRAFSIASTAITGQTQDLNVLEHGARVTYKGMTKRNVEDPVTGYLTVRTTYSD